MVKKRAGKPSVQTKKKQKTTEDFPEDDFFGGESEEDDLDKDQGLEEEEEEEEEETADEKRLRLAKEYLTSLELDKEDLTSDEEVEDAISHRLQKDVTAESGNFQKKIAHQFASTTISESQVRVCRGHQLSPTCLSVSQDDTTAFTGSKDCSIIKWDIETGAKFTISKYRKEKAGSSAEGREFHKKGVMSIAVSEDGNLLASGGNDNGIYVWDLRSEELVCAKTFDSAHRGPISCLAFKRNSRQLFSGSTDRVIKVWNLDNFSFIEELYGHQSEVTSIDSLYHDNAVSVGSDKSLRLWKIMDETQLVFNGPQIASIDCVSMINEEKYFTGSQDGSLSVWSSKKKKPLCTYRRAHNDTWISSVDALAFSDVLASGASDGVVRLWECPDDTQRHSSLRPLHTIPMTGFINGLHIAKGARFLVAAVGQEHRLGRWQRIQAARNGIQIAQLKGDDNEVFDDGADEDEVDEDENGMDEDESDEADDDEGEGDEDEDSIDVTSKNISEKKITSDETSAAEKDDDDDEEEDEGDDDEENEGDDDEEEEEKIPPLRSRVENTRTRNQQKQPKQSKQQKQQKQETKLRRGSRKRG